MLNKLLRSDISPWQTAAYAVANLIGLLIVGIAVQANADFRRNVGRDAASDPLEASRYTVVAPKSATSLFGSPSISPALQEQLLHQPWVEAGAPFTPSNFDVTVSVDFAGAGFSTALFLESVPDEFLDVAPVQWHFNPAEPTVDMILPRDYLMLYNFGYAPSRGLPTLDERAVAALPLRVTLSGNGVSQTFPGRIVGFSSRINTVAVPGQLLQWANAHFSPTTAPAIKRMILKISDPGNPQVDEFLASHGLVESNGGAEAARLYRFIDSLTAAVVAIGLLIALVSAGMLILSVFLLLQKSRPTLQRLIDLGYTRRRLAAFYIRFALIVNASILLLAAIILAVLSLATASQLAEMAIRPASIWPAILTQLAVVAILSLLSARIIRRYTRRIA